ncbi:hypothetical protein HDU97_007845 [Phlyctochytrium planicorne]|nr:hypothetical protein HDU97_007845 [Phlyctochytrium planicorne]
MSGKVIVVAGFGPGISRGVAEKFGQLGYKVALVSRTQSKLDEGVKELSAKYISAKAFAADLSDPTIVKTTITQIQKTFGSIGILFWNPYGPFSGALDANVEDLIANFNLSNTSLLVAVKTALEDLKANKGAILATGGGMALENDFAVQMALQYNAASAVIAKAAARKTVHLLNASLKKDGVYAGEVTVLGQVKGTPFDADGKATLTGEAVGDAFVKLEKERDRVFTEIK